jgi:HSP20 family protein
MPGARSETITIRLEKDELSISARRDADASGQLLAGGRRDCEYRRSFLVPRGVEANQVTAEISQGVLKVHLPKAAAARPRVIEVKASN